jgi:hypothetical protein
MRDRAADAGACAGDRGDVVSRSMALSPSFAEARMERSGPLRPPDEPANAG